MAPTIEATFSHRAAPKPGTAQGPEPLSAAERNRLALLCKDADDALSILHPQNVRLMQGSQTFHVETPPDCKACRLAR